MPGWEAFAAEGGKLFNEGLIRGIKSGNWNPFSSDFWADPEPDLPPLYQLQQELMPQLEGYLRQALSGQAGFSQEEMDVLQAQQQQQLGQMRQQGTQALTSGQYGRPTGTSQQQLANLYSGLNAAQMQSGQNLFLMQEQAKRAAQQGAAQAALGAAGQGGQQYLQGVFPWQAANFQQQLGLGQGMGDAFLQFSAAQNQQSQWDEMMNLYRQQQAGGQGGFGMPEPGSQPKG